MSGVSSSPVGKKVNYSSIFKIPLPHLLNHTKTIHIIPWVILKPRYRTLSMSQRNFLHLLAKMSMCIIILTSLLSISWTVLPNTMRTYDGLIKCLAAAAQSEIRLNYPDDGGSVYLWNISKLLPDYMAQHPRGQSSSRLTSVQWHYFISLPFNIIFITHQQIKFQKYLYPSLWMYVNQFITFPETG
jgi:hypothetical protein